VGGTASRRSSPKLDGLQKPSLLYIFTAHFLSEKCLEGGAAQSKAKAGGQTNQRLECAYQGFAIHPTRPEPYFVSAFVAQGASSKAKPKPALLERTGLTRRDARSSSFVVRAPPSEAAQGTNTDHCKTWK
jgi:hypothetical protein